MYVKRLKDVLSTKRGLQLTLSSGESEKSLEFSQEAVAQMLRALQGAGDAVGEGPLTLGVLGHQVVRTPRAYGLLLRTQELGQIVFSLPPAILKMLIADLMHLESSARSRSHAGDVARGRGKAGARQSQS